MNQYESIDTSLIQSDNSYENERIEISLFSLLQDGLVLVFLVRALIPAAYMGLEGYRLQGILFPVWLVMILWGDRSHSLWQSITKCRGAFVGLCGYIIYLLIITFFGHGLDASGHLFSLRDTIPLYIMGCYYGFYYPTRFWKICGIVFAILGVQAAYSLPKLTTDPFVVRNVMANSMFLEEGKVYSIHTAWDIALNGVGDYSLYTSNAILTAIFAGFSLNERKRISLRIFWFFALIALILANIQSTFTAASIISICGTLVVLIRAITYGKIRLPSVILLFGAMTVGTLLFISMVAETGPFEYVYNKAWAIFEGVGSGGLAADPTTRGEGIIMSLSALAGNPLFGSGAIGSKSLTLGTLHITSGGHSSWLDVLLQYGLVGAFWCYLIVYSIGKQTLKSCRMIKDELLPEVFLIAYGCYILYGLINPVLRMRSIDFVLYFVLIGGAFAFEKQASLNAMREK